LELAGFVTPLTIGLIAERSGALTAGPALAALSVFMAATLFCFVAADFQNTGT
jgi:hypothetical protein